MAFTRLSRAASRVHFLQLRRCEVARINIGSASAAKIAAPRLNEQEKANMDSSEKYKDETVVVEQRSSAGIWTAIAFVVLAGVALFAYADAHRSQRTISQMTAQAQDMNSTIGQLQNQLNDVNSKMSDMQAAQNAAAASAAAQAKAASTVHAKPDPRWGKVQGQLDAEQQQLNTEQGAISDQQNALNQARTDLQGSISSAHDELAGTIAKNHDELVALEQKGERNYDEFDLARGKNNRFYRVGPISLALRKADPKHDHYDIAMMVDDKQMQKKNVNLYEPILIGDSQDAQPVEVVVNKIDKDHIHGYVESAKYSAEMRQTAAPANNPAPETPDNTSTPVQDNTPQSN
jgi:hypothetical protein